MLLLFQILGLLLGNDNGCTAKYIRKHHLVCYYKVQTSRYSCPHVYPYCCLSVLLPLIV